MVGELGSGDPNRVRQAVLAQQANEKYGIGGWGWGNNLVGLGPFQSTGGEIIPLGEPKIK